MHLRPCKEVLWPGLVMTRGSAVSPGNIYGVQAASLGSRTLVVWRFSPPVTCSSTSKNRFFGPAVAPMEDLGAEWLPVSGGGRTSLRKPREDYRPLSRQCCYGKDPCSICGRGLHFTTRTVLLRQKRHEPVRPP